MLPRSVRHVAVSLVFIAGAASAQETPILDMAAKKVIQKYESATCEQLWEQRGKPKSPEEQRIVHFLQSDPELRAKFLNEVAGPIANKLFSCGMIP